MVGSATILKRLPFVMVGGPFQLQPEPVRPYRQALNDGPWRAKLFFSQTDRGHGPV